MKKNMFKRFVCVMLSVCTVVTLAGFSAFADDETENIEDIITLEEDIGDTDIGEDSGDSDSDSDDKDNGDVSLSPDSETDEDKDNDGDVSEEEDNIKDDTAVAGGSGENCVVTVPAKNIRLKINQKNKITIGDTFQIKFSFSPLKSDDYVTYRNFNKSIVRVDENGLVTAVGYGKAKIQLITTGGRKKNVYFTVTNAEGDENAEPETGEVTEIEFADEFIMLRKGKTYQSETIFYPFGYYANLTYSSSDTSVASVTESGKIKGRGAGTAVITAEAENGVKAEMSVTVYDDIYRGIDVSKWQGDINWKKVSVSGIDFVMIRASFGSENVDEYLGKNVKGCEKYDIPYGFYHYTYARTAAEAKNEAKFFLNNIRGYSPEYPIVLDIEEEFYKKMDRDDVTKVITAFMDVLKNAGYYVMVYNSPNFIKACIDSSELEKYDIWIACWGDEERLNSLYNGHYGMWQYSATGKVSGINGDVDLDYSYKNYEAYITENGFNNLE